MTRRERILGYLKQHKKLSCTQITQMIIKDEKIKPSRYLSGGISGVLLNMVTRWKELEYAEGKSVRGGNLFQLRDCTPKETVVKSISEIVRESNPYSSTHDSLIWNKCCDYFKALEDEAQKTKA